MSSVGNRFNTFLSNIELTSIQIEDARTKYNGVCKCLHDYYYSQSYNVSTKLLVGSYGKNTAIAPPSYVDILFILPSSEFTKYSSLQGNGQSQLLQVIKIKLLEKYPSTTMRADGQVVMVNFVSYNIEVVPSFTGQNGNYIIPNTSSGGSWKFTNPNAEMDQISQSNKKTNGNTVKLIKLIKAWKYYCNVPIKSLVIELRAINFLNKWIYYDKSSIYYDWMVRDFLKELLEFKNHECQIPGINEKIVYGDEWESKAKTALINAERACKLESEEKEDSATFEWKKIFGDRFYY